jgi:hypothetical protein
MFCCSVSDIRGCLYPLTMEYVAAPAMNKTGGTKNKYSSGGCYGSLSSTLPGRTDFGKAGVSGQRR